MANAKKGGGAIDRAVAHFSAQEVRTIEVPEWGDDDGPLLIYVEPFTLREQGRLHNASNGGGDDDSNGNSTITHSNGRNTKSKMISMWRGHLSNR